MYDKIIRLPLSYYNIRKRGDVVSRAVNDTQEVQNAILASLKTFLTEPVSLIVFLVALFCISVKLSLYALLLLPVTFLLIALVSSSLRAHSRSSKQRLGSLIAHVDETLGGLRIIKGFNAQDDAERVFNNLNDKYAVSQTLVYRLVDLSSPLSEFLGVTSVMIVLIIGGTMVLSNQASLSAEMFITYIALFTQVVTPLKNISTAFSNYKRGQAALDRIFSVLDSDESIHSAENPVHVEQFQHELTISDLSFAYGDNLVIDHLSMTLKKGEIVALVGPSGSGKSTIVDLVERFYDPIQGQVLFDGVDIRDISLQQYRSFFSLVSQDIVLFNDTIYGNVTMGTEHYSEQDVINALKVANIYDFVQTLPDGIYHRLSDRGMNLSGGQRQRISIARAILRNAPILILDEATSAMDTESEHLVQDALNKVMQNRTVLVIAHRLSTIYNADCIYVLDKGRMVEKGRHEELMSKDGLYSKLIKIQQFN